MEERQQLEQKLEEFLENLRQFSIVVYDYQRESKHTFKKKINDGIIRSLRDLDSMKDGPPIYIPVELLSYVDQGRNPDSYTRDMLYQTLDHNQSTNGKIEALKQFRTMLDEEASRFFPEEFARFQQIQTSQEYDNV